MRWNWGTAGNEWVYRGKWVVGSDISTLNLYSHTKLKGKYVKYKKSSKLLGLTRYLRRVLEHSLLHSDGSSGNVGQQPFPTSFGVQLKGSVSWVCPPRAPFRFAPWMSQLFQFFFASHNSFICRHARFSSPVERFNVFSLEARSVMKKRNDTLIFLHCTFFFINKHTASFLVYLQIFI